MSEKTQLRILGLFVGYGIASLLFDIIEFIILLSK